MKKLTTMIVLLFLVFVGSGIAQTTQAIIQLHFRTMSGFPVGKLNMFIFQNKKKIKKIGGADTELKINLNKSASYPANDIYAITNIDSLIGPKPNINDLKIYEFSSLGARHPTEAEKWACDLNDDGTLTDTEERKFYLYQGSTIYRHGKLYANDSKVSVVGNRIYFRDIYRETYDITIYVMFKMDPDMSYPYHEVVINPPKYYYSIGDTIKWSLSKPNVDLPQSKVKYRVVFDDNPEDYQKDKNYSTFTTDTFMVVKDTTFFYVESWVYNYNSTPQQTRENQVKYHPQLQPPKISYDGESAYCDTVMLPWKKQYKFIMVDELSDTSNTLPGLVIESGWGGPSFKYKTTWNAPDGISWIRAKIRIIAVVPFLPKNGGGDLNFTESNYGPWKKIEFPTTGVKGVNSGPTEFSLEQNYPNPFNPSTTINYSLPNNSSVKIVIFDMTGKVVRELVNVEKSSGVHSIIWNGNDDSGNKVGSGIYFYKIKAGNFSAVKKLTLMK